LGLSADRTFITLHASLFTPNTLPLINQLQDILTSLGSFGPELWLTIAFCGLLIAELVLLRQSTDRLRHWLGGLTIACLLIAGALVLNSSGRGFLFLHLLFVDDQAIFFKLVIALAAILVVGYETLNITATNKIAYPQNGFRSYWLRCLACFCSPCQLICWLFT